MSCHLSFAPLPSHPKNIIVGSTSGQTNTQLATNAIAPYASALIGDTFDHTDDPNKAAQLLSHAILGAIIARANGGNEYSGAASAVVSEETAMILAKELYPEAFDENGNFDRSQLNEEQANGILALSSAIGAFTAGLSGGSVYDASVGGFIGQNAVEDNKMTLEQAQNAHRTLYKQCVNARHTDCNKIHIMLVKGSSDNYYITGNSFVDDPSPRDMITNSAFNVPDYVTVNTPLGGVSINMYDGTLFANTPSVGSSMGGNFSIVGGTVLNNDGNYNQKGNNVNTFLGGISFTSGASAAGVYGGINQSIITNPKDIGSPTTAVENGLATPSIDLGSVGYSTQITGNNNGR